MLNVTTIALSSGTPVVAFSGSVETMIGFRQDVKKLHGFGTGPGESGAPVSSEPDVISTVYRVHVVKAAV